VTKTPGTLLVTGTGDNAAMLVRSTDAGKTWTMLRDGNNTDSFRSAISHPDGRLFWAPYQLGTLQVSSDDGATWTDLFADYQPQQLLCDAVHPNAILAATYNRLVRIT
jgi:photosystem II stability/assembly factor-like uncharacterized protein